MTPTPDQVDLVLAHANCFDGFTSLWVAWLCRGDAAEYVQVFHHEDPPDVKGRHVAILDFAYKRDVLERMAAEAASLIVLDHHVTAQADLAGLDYAIFDMDRSGARLAFDWFLGDHGPWVGVPSPGGPRVIAVQGLCDYRRLARATCRGDPEPATGGSMTERVDVELIEPETTRASPSDVAAIRAMVKIEELRLELSKIRAGAMVIAIALLSWAAVCHATC